MNELDYLRSLERLLEARLIATRMLITTMEKSQKEDTCPTSFTLQLTTRITPATSSGTHGI